MISILLQLSQFLLFSHLAIGSSYVPLSIGPDFQAGFGEDAIFSGLKLNINDRESFLRDKIFEGNITLVPFRTSNQKTVLIKDEESLEDYMDIGSGLGISYGPMCCGYASNYLKNKASPYEATIAYRYQRVAYAKKVNQFNLVEELRNPDSDLDADTIAEKYGTKFIDQLNYGAQLDVEITFKSRDKTSIRKIKSELKGNTNLQSIQKKFETNFGLSEEVEIVIKAQVSGFNFLTPFNPTIEQIIDAKNNLDEKFNREVEQENLQAFSPIEFSVASIADHIESLPSNEVSRLESKLNDAREVLYSALFFKQTLVEIRNEQASIYSDPRDKNLLFNQYSEEVEKITKLLDHKTEECLRYRRHTLKELEGRGEIKIPQVPENYVKDDIAVGLIGESYLPSPVTIGTTEFINMHYVGYSIEIDGIMKPWLSGLIRNNEDKVIAKAKRPQDLEKLGQEQIDFDGRKVIIRTKKQNEMKEFHLHQWIGERKADGTNLEYFEIANKSSSISLEYMVQLQDMGRQDWVSSGFVGSNSKYITGFAIRIIEKDTQHTVSYKAYKEDSAGGTRTTQRVSDGKLCGGGEGAIKAIYVSIDPIERAVPCETTSVRCQCGTSMCHDPDKTFSPTLFPSLMPSLSPSLIPSSSPSLFPTSSPSSISSSTPSSFPTSATPVHTSNLTSAPMLDPTQPLKQTPFPNSNPKFTKAPASIITDDAPTDAPTPDKACAEESAMLNICEEKKLGECGNCAQNLSKIKLMRSSTTDYCEEMKGLLSYCGCDICEVEKDTFFNCLCNNDENSVFADETSGSKENISKWLLLKVISFTTALFII